MKLYLIKNKYNKMTKSSYFKLFSPLTGYALSVGPIFPKKVIHFNMIFCKG